MTEESWDLLTCLEDFLAQKWKETPLETIRSEQRRGADPNQRVPEFDGAERPFWPTKSSKFQEGSRSRHKGRFPPCRWVDMRHKQIDVKHKQTDGSRVPLFIRPRQVPDLFGISERQVRELMMRGDLREGLHWFKKSSRMVLLSVQALDEWIKEG